MSVSQRGSPGSPVGGHLRLASLLLEAAAREAGLATHRLDPTVLVIDGPHRVHPFVGFAGPDYSRVAKHLAMRPALQTTVLRSRSVPTSPSRLVEAGDRASAIKFLGSAPGWVAGTVVGSRRRLAAADAEAAERCWTTLDRGAQRSSDGAVLLQDLPDTVVAVTLVDQAPIAATRLRAERIVGDGESTLSDLLSSARRRAAAHPLLATAPQHVPLWSTDLGVGYSEDPHLVLGRGDVMPCDPGRHLLSVGALEDVTATCSTQLVRLARAALAAFPGLRSGVVGIDYRNPTDPRVTVVLPEPAPFAHYPTAGAARDIASAIVRAFCR